MAGKYPSSNDRDYDLIRKIADNTAAIADSPGGGVTSIVAGTGISISGATGDVTVTADTQASLDAISATQGSVLYRNAADWVALTPGTSGQFFTTQGAAANPVWSSAGSGSGSFNGPGSATDNAVVRFDGITGQLGQNSAVTIADTTGSTTWSNTGAVLTVAGTTASTSTTTGSLINAGGFGNAGAAYFGGQANFQSSHPQIVFGSSASAINNIGFIATSAGRYIQLEGNRNPSTGVFVNTSGTHAGMAFDTGTGDGNITFRTAATDNTLGTVALKINKNQGLEVYGTTASIGVGTGALQVSGGIYAGAASVFAGAVTISGAGVSSIAGNTGIGSTSPNFTGYGIDTSVLTVGGSGAKINGVIELYGTRTTNAQLGHVTFGNSGTRVAEIVASRIDADNSARLEFWTSNGGSLARNMTLGKTGDLDLAGAATFAGAVAIGNTVSVVSPTSPNRTITIVVGGVTLYIAAKTTND